MKRILFFLVLLFPWAVSAGAFSYAEAREEAYFLTDKMAYELNLTSEQYNRVYQVNLDYLLSIDAGRDRMDTYVAYREADLRYILAEWQYSLYRTLSYFIRPVVWLPRGWHFAIYDHYRRGYLYFGRPTVFVSYRGQPWLRRRPHDASPYRYVRHGHGRGMRDHYFGDRGRRPDPGVGREPHSDRHGGPGATRPGRPGGHVGSGATHDRGAGFGRRPGGTDRNPGGADRPGGPSRDGNRSIRPAGGRGREANFRQGDRPSVSRGSSGRGTSGRTPDRRPSSGRNR